MEQNKKNPVDEVLKIFRHNYNHQVILYGPPGTSKTYSSTIIAAKFLSGDDSYDDYEQAKEYLENDGKKYYQLVQFHPSYNYDDFVRGIEMSINEDSKQPEYKTVNKVFGEFAEIANQDKSKKYVLVIDEINRAPLATVLGELIYGLEYRGRAISTPYKLTPESGKNNNGHDKIVIPDNLYIIGTMNTADRSIGSIDYAVRRRFAFVPLLSDIEIALDTWKNVKVDGKDFSIQRIQKLSEEVDKIKFVEDICSDDVRLGHSYFMFDKKKFGGRDAITEDELRGYMEYRIEYQVKPILKEYMNDGLIDKNQKSKIDELEWK